MNRTRILFAVGLAAVLGLIVSGYVYRQLRRVADAQRDRVRTSNIIVAAARLPLGTQLHPQNLRAMAWPGDAPVEGMCSRVEDCVDRTLLSSVEENELILESKLAPKAAGAGLPATIPAGMRAASVAVNEVVGVAGFVQPGTRVDVLVTGTETGQNSSRRLTRTILENVPVLAAGQKLEQDREGKPQVVPVVTLLVTPEQANALTLASTDGKIQLVLRNTTDAKKVEPPPVFEAALFGGAAPPVKTGPRPHLAPVNLAAPPYTIEMIRGGKKEVNTFPNQ
jgi:pilus assembly protein CpaB